MARPKPKPPQKGVVRTLPAFKPYVPPPLPTGTYDPSLEAQRTAAQRGYGDLQQDTSLAGSRAIEDYGFQTGQLDLARQRTDADYNTNVQLLTKHYSDLASAQSDQANAYGVIPGGGAYLQSAAKRAANQGLEQQGLDTTHTRALQDIQNQEGLLGVDYGRGVTDRVTQLTRAGRENQNYGLDIGAEEAYQAGQAQYQAPLRGQKGGIPANEHILASGVHTRTRIINGIQYTYDQNGRVLKRVPVRTITTGVRRP